LDKYQIIAQKVALNPFACVSFATSILLILCLSKGIIECLVCMFIFMLDVFVLSFGLAFGRIHTHTHTHAHFVLPIRLRDRECNCNQKPR
jgi:hypothetical protein